MPIATYLNTSTTLNQQKIDFHSGGSSSRSDNQLNSQTTMTQNPHNRVMYSGSFTYGQWANHVGTTPYGVSAAQNSLPYPYSAYYGMASPMLGSHQNHTYGQFPFAHTYTQSDTQLRDGQVGKPQSHSNSGPTSMNEARLQGSSSRDQATTQISEARSQGTAPVFISHVTATAKNQLVDASSEPCTSQETEAGSSQLSNFSDGEKSVCAATQSGDNSKFGDPHQPSLSESSPIDPSTLTLEPTQLAEILRANPALASVVLAALGQTQRRV